MRTDRRWTLVAVLATGMVVGIVMGGTPAAAHVGGSVSHLWSHLKGKADARYLPGNNLPSGKTMRGTYMIGFSATGANQYAEDGYTFQQQLRSNPTAVHFIPLSGTPPSACPGTGAFPRAARGHLCLYENAGFNVDPGSFIIASPVTNTAGQSSRWGFRLEIRSAGAGLFFSGGTWAVTAP
jgi:hypothetical protein